MAQSTRPRVPDATLRSRVAAGFLHHVGRAATPAELNTLRPLWEVMGYDKGDAIWGVVFVFAKQLAAVDVTLQQSSDLTKRASDVIDKAASELAASIDQSGQQAREEFRDTVGEIQRRHRWLRFTLGLVVGASSMFAGAVYFHYPLHGGIVHVMEGFDPGLAARMMLAPNTVMVWGPTDKAQYLQLNVLSCNASINRHVRPRCTITHEMEWKPTLSGGSD